MSTQIPGPVPQRLWRMATTMLVMLCAVSRAEDLPTVAVSDFAVPRDQPHRQAAASDAADLLATLVLDDARFRWVDRQHLKQVLRERMRGYAVGDLGAALREGRLVGAQMLVTGRFTVENQTHWRLTIEVLDPTRADVLASRTMRLASPATESPTLNEAEVRELVAGLRDDLGNAWDLHQQSHASIAVAPLFFHNTTEGNRRLDRWQDELLDAFVEADEPWAAGRILRYPRVQESLGETELMLSGLVESDPNAPRPVADVYIWGTYREVDWQGVPFEQVKIDVEATIWASGREPMTVQETGIVAQRAELTNRLVQRILSVVSQLHQHGGPGISSPSMAQHLFKQAQTLQQQNVMGEMNVNATWLGRWRHIIRLLDTACLFDPGRRDLHIELINECYRVDLTVMTGRGTGTDYKYENRQWRQLAEFEAWGKHVERFGLEGQWPPYWPFDRSIHDNRIRCTTVIEAYLESAREIFRPFPYGTHRQNPLGLPPDTLDALRADLETEYVQRLVTAAEWPDAPQALLTVALRNAHDVYPKVVADPSRRAALTDAVLPRLHEPINEHRHRDLVSAFRRLGKELADPARAEAWIAALPAPKPSSRPAVVASTAPPPPPSLPVNDNAFKRFHFPSSFDVQQIDDLHVYKDRMWIAASGIELGDGPPRPASSLWNYNDEVSRLYRIDQKMPIRTRIVQLASKGTVFWMTTEDKGLLWTPGVFPEAKQFTPEHGLPGDCMPAIAISGDYLALGGGDRHGPPQLALFDPRGGTWAAQTVETFNGDRQDVQPMVMYLAATPNQILAAGDHLGMQPFLSLLDRSTGLWHDVREPMVTHLRDHGLDVKHKELRTYRLIYSHDRFWIAHRYGLTCADVNGHPVFTWPASSPANPRPETMAARGIDIPYALTVDTRNRIWMASSSRDPSRAEQHDAVTLWAFDATGRNRDPMHHRELGHVGRATAIVVYRGVVYIGVRGSASSIVCFEIN